MNLKKFVEFLFFLKLQKSHPTKHRTGKILAFSEFAKISENALKNGSALAFWEKFRKSAQDGKIKFYEIQNLRGM